MQKINYLLGNQNFNSTSGLIYNDLICDFVNDFSKELFWHPTTKKFPDIKALAFWCRKQNIETFKKKLNNKELRLGLGSIFHITPSNVPTNFAYSLLFGLLNGNSNIVKVPSQKFEQIEIICSCLKKILKKKKYLKVRNLINIVRYQDNDKFTKKISSLCDARIIWGGDKTVNEIRKFPVGIRARDIAFSDRFSLCVINANQISKLDKLSFSNLIEKFYNDTYLVDQNACSSPHLIVWIENKKSEIKNIFWKKLFKFATSKYEIPDIASIDKYSKLCEDLVNLNNIKNYKIFSNILYVVSLKNLNVSNKQLRSKWGYFYEYNTNDLNSIVKLIDKACQTLTYIGFSKDILEKFVFKNNLKGIDRIVPIGQGLNISLNWDGYNINETLSRVIDLK